MFYALWVFVLFSILYSPSPNEIFTHHLLFHPQFLLEPEDTFATSALTYGRNTRTKLRRSAE